MRVDECAPASLFVLQSWFGHFIERPLTDKGKIQDFTPKGECIKKEAARCIRPSRALEAYQRLEIYNQQYWYRLISSLQENFPLLVRLLGYNHFNTQIAIPYLVCHRPTCWSLNYLGDQLPSWALENYQGEKRSLVLLAAKIDQAYNQSFLAAALPSLRSELSADQPLEPFLTKLLYLQPHLFLLHSAYPLLPLRKEIIAKEASDEANREFPQVEEREGFYAISRNLHNCVYWKELSSQEFQMLTWISQGKTLAVCCEQMMGEQIEGGEEAIAFWTQDWLLRDWITLHSYPF